VLVRAREHLSSISRELHGAGLAFRAVDVQPLAIVPVVQDLHALTRALLHLGDRVAWLAILRAPWCGLTLADLHALAGRHDHTVVGRRSWTSVRSRLAKMVSGARPA
jgi:ATP-dependent exoDNAse (exonuclease V) beta subunit